MKNLIFSALTMAAIALTGTIQAQDIIRQQTCQSQSVQHQIDSLKRYYSAHGFSLMREASMQMEKLIQTDVSLWLKKPNRNPSIM